MLARLRSRLATSSAGHLYAALADAAALLLRHCRGELRRALTRRSR